MKKLYLVALVFSFFCNIVPQTWQLQSVKPAGVDLYDVVALSSTRVLAFGMQGKEVISTDAGETWQVNSLLSITNDIYATSFLSDNMTGWIVGSAGMIMKTTDGGDNWVSQTSNTSNQLSDIEFASDNVSGIAVGASGTVVTTTNGGTTWIVQTAPTGTTAILKVCIVPTTPNPTVYIGSTYSSGRLMKSTNFGVSFTNATPTGITSLGVYSMCYSDNLHYWIGLSSTLGVYYTTNGGTSWSASTGGTMQIFDLKYASTTPVGVDGGALYWTTTNSGASWTKTQLPSGKALRAITFNGTNYIAVGYCDAILKSTNSGATWSVKASGLDQGFIRNVVFKDDNFGLAGTQGISGGGGIGGNLWKTTDGGANWSVLYAFGSANQIYTIAMTSDNIWYIGLDKNLFYKTTDAGATFTQMTVPFSLASQTFWCSAFSDPLNGYFGTAGGNLIKTTDGGTTWTDLTSAAGFTQTIYSIQIKSASELYVCGTAPGPVGRLVKTTDGGTTFSPLSPGFTPGMYSIKFKDNNLGFLGGLGYVSRTTDNGTTWTATAVNGSVYWFGFNGSTVWYVAGSGQLGTSTDNGATWTATTLSSNGLWCMALSNNNMWVSASQGTMLKGTTTSYALTLNLKSLLEAMYVSGGGVMTMTPDVTIELHDASTLAVVESKTATISTSGVGTFTFTSAANGTPYFIVIKSPNTVETWSAGTVSFNNNLLTYDFTTGTDKAYTDGSNPSLVEHSPKYCIYSGDVNQDGFVTNDDFTGVDNDASVGDWHVENDVNGDGFVTNDDFTFIDNNASVGLAKQVPPGAPAHLVKHTVKNNVQKSTVK
jgi:photosystem II stability/assembly factor-like uncharacterized protein